jgi:hypothetical protein
VWIPWFRSPAFARKDKDTWTDTGPSVQLL